ncbi:MAG TPA: DUF3618 domain-containing protein [Pseudonocardia sp.]|jgi:ElaB/YqjD/DUF883 family membrane-anchored ribosome-binding protein|uniref:DUF3618 domain-containing protein n=1 Tax=Pseudonocardia sp. TaxID=60912 RepID=UPI002B4B8ABD|nr:DUF3618 domain-containing protein [Pseudonocardia sp.]HLU60478.1 DUF3618 domain-containing protein [Pseudonocardia sp.]
MSAPDGDRTPARGEIVERDVERLRAEIGDTVEELVHRVDVPQRLREKRAETSERVHDLLAHTREVVTQKATATAPVVEEAVRTRPLVVGGVIAALLLLLLRSTRRRSTHRKEDTGATR